MSFITVLFVSAITFVGAVTMPTSTDTKAAGCSGCCGATCSSCCLDANACAACCGAGCTMACCK